MARKFYSAETKEHCLWMARQGKSYPEITKATGVSRERVNAWLRKAGAKYPPQSTPQRPSKTIRYENGRKFYSERIRSKCIDLWRRGQTFRQIAKTMRVNNASTVKYWVYEHIDYRKKPEAIKG